MEWITWTMKRWNRRMVFWPSDRSDENESSSAVSESLSLWIFFCWNWMRFSQGSWSCCPNDLMLLIHWMNLVQRMISLNRLESLFTQTQGWMSLWYLTWWWWREFVPLIRKPPEDIWTKPQPSNPRHLPQTIIILFHNNYVLFLLWLVSWSSFEMNLSICIKVSDKWVNVNENSSFLMLFIHCMFLGLYFY